MRTFSRRHRRTLQGPHLWSVRMPGIPPVPGPADVVVTLAEELLHDAWLRTLRDECEHTEAEMRAASARCDVARRDLVAVLLGRTTAPRHLDLESRLASARIAASAHRQALAVLAEELGRRSHRARRLPDRLGSGSASRDPGDRGSARRARALGWLTALGRFRRRIASRPTPHAPRIPGDRRL